MTCWHVLSPLWELIWYKKENYHYFWIDRQTMKNITIWLLTEWLESFPHNYKGSGSNPHKSVMNVNSFFKFK